MVVTVRDAVGDVESVLVFGGRSELAVATVAALAARRTKTVVLAVRDPNDVDTEIELLRAAGATTVEAVAFDALEFESHEAIIAHAWKHFGEFDLVIVAFGSLGDQPRADSDAQHALEIVRANFDGAVSVLVPVAAAMTKQGHGTIVVFSSVAAERPRRANYAYGSAKAGLDAFANGLADRLVGSGVHLVVVRSGWVATRMTRGLHPAPFATTADVVAAAIVKGIARKRTVVYAPEILRYVMVALRFVPRPIWRRMRA